MGGKTCRGSSEGSRQIFPQMITSLVLKAVICSSDKGGISDLVRTQAKKAGLRQKFVLESSESDIPGAATLILSASTHRAGVGTTVKTERGEHVTTGNRTRVVRLAVTNANHYTKRFVLESSESDIPGAATLILSASTHRAGVGTTVKTERGEHVTTGNRTRVVRLAVTNANHYTKRSHDHLAWPSSRLYQAPGSGWKV
ncbi:hypothetical protein Bbelb_153780 [Branchiostoma belcheri]|nr:hypothetical protein Bbelb_153780 [Branchiostoma belcheri]